MKKFLLITLLIYSQLILATIKLDVDILRSPDHTKVWTPPSTTTTLIGTDTTNDLTNKSFDLIRISAEQVNAAATGANATLAAPTSTLYKVSNASLTSVDGITAPSANIIISLQNKTGAAIDINDATGTAANQIITGTGDDLTLENDATVLLQYSLTYDKWYVVGGSGGGGAFVDLTTNQSVGGVKTFTSGIEVDSVESTGASGVVIKNSGGTTVATIGPSNGTTSTFAGTVTGSNLSGTNTGDLLTRDDSEGADVTTNKIEYPAFQAVTTSAGVRRLDTGNTDVLNDGDYEGSSFASIGLTCTTGTCTKTTTSGEFIPNAGKSALKVALSAQAMNVVHTVTIGSGMVKQGAVGVFYRVPSTMTDFQICSYVDSVEQSCIPTGNLVKNDTFQYAEIPIVFGSTSAGIKYKTTSSFTADAFFDKAFVKFGLSTQNLMTDNVYSAKVSSAGVVSDENKDFINGNASVSTNAYTITFSSRYFTVAPNCQATLNEDAGSFAIVSAVSASSVTVKTYSDASANTNRAFVIECQKQGNDYLASSANVYSTASANYDWTAFTPTTTGLGTITAGNTCKHKRLAERLYVECFFTTGTTAPSLGSITLPNSLTIDSAKLGVNNTTGGSGQRVGWSLAQGNAGSFIPVVTATGTATDKIYFAANATGAAALLPANGNATHFTGTVTSINFDVPISGWSNSNVIVGSFQDYVSTPGGGAVKMYAVRVSDNSGTVGADIGDLVNGNASLASNDFTYTFNSGRFTGTPICVAACDRADETCWATTGSASSSGIIVSTYNTGGAAARAHTLYCFGN